jgi:hypothetical protein
VLTEFWSTIAGKLSDRWAAILAPSVVFWAGGVLAWAYADHGWSRLTVLTARLSTQDVATKLLTLVAAVLVVVLSSLVVQRLTLPTLRLLEGYWPSWMRRFTRWRRRAASRRKAADEQQLQKIQLALEQGDLTAEQLREQGILEHRRRHRPVRDYELLPTRIGNILRAAETRPYHRYGLEAVVIWPRLWLVLPELARQEIAVARSAMDSSVAVAVWALLFTGFTPLAWWAAPAGLFVAGVAVAWWVPNNAEVFANLVEGAYDLYRGALYRHLRWPLPATPADERHTGQELTRYLMRGSDKSFPEFTDPV